MIMDKVNSAADIAWLRSFNWRHVYRWARLCQDISYRHRPGISVVAYKVDANPDWRCSVPQHNIHNWCWSSWLAMGNLQTRASLQIPQCMWNAIWHCDCPGKNFVHFTACQSHLSESFFRSWTKMDHPVSLSTDIPLMHCKYHSSRSGGTDLYYGMSLKF